MNSMKQFIVLVSALQGLQYVVSKPIFKGLSFKKNYEMEISAIPFKHISFIKEKWFPFKMIGIKHDIAKREVVEDPKDENLYSVNEVFYDNEDVSNVPGRFTSINNVDSNLDAEIISNPAPVVENIQPVHIKPVLETENLGTGIVQTSSVIPINPSLVIAPSIHTMGTVVQPAAVVPIDLLVANAAHEETEVQPAIHDEITPIQPLHTHVDIPPVELEESSKMHTDISSAVPLNTLVASPVQEMDLPLPVDIKVPAPVVETPEVQPIAVSPAVITSVVGQPVVEPPAPAPVVETPILAPIIELPTLVPEAAIETPAEMDKFNKKLKIREERKNKKLEKKRRRRLKMIQKLNKHGHNIPIDGSLPSRHEREEAEVPQMHL